MQRLIDTYGDGAINEWLQNHKAGDGWTPVDGVYVNGDPLVLLESENDEYRYSVQYRGNGKYFKGADEAYMYMARRAGENKRPPFENKNEPFVLLNKQQIKYAEVVWIEDRNWVLLQGILDKETETGDCDFVTWLPDKKRNYYNRMHHRMALEG